MEKITELFLNLSTRPDKVCVLFHGNKGVGKRFTVYNILWSNTPDDLKHKILDYKSQDILELSGEDGIDTYKENIPVFNSPPKELPYKVLILRDVDLCNSTTANFLLKIIEEPRFYHIFMTATNLRGVNKAILSRSMPFRFLPFSVSELEHIIQKDPKKQMLAGILQKRQYPYTSVYELELCFTLQIPELYSALFAANTGIDAVNQEVNALLGKIKSYSVSDKSKIAYFISSFVIHCSRRELQNNTPFHLQLNKLVERFSGSLLNSQKTGGQFNIEMQLKAFLISMYILRKIICST